MDQDIEIINTQTNIEKMKNLFINNKKIIISLISIIILSIFLVFFYFEFKESKKNKLSNEYNDTITNFKSKINDNTVEKLKNLIMEKDSTYSPLALYFLIDNDLIKSKDEINNFFNIIINDINLDEEIKYLIIYKKALYNSELVNEDELLNILSPVISSESIWKSHALYLMAEYFFSKGEKIKSKEFFEQILSLENSNQNIKIEAEKRIKRDFSE
tara:strand:+ start:558 stop:1202 length:645 start_codon:yes stop_codon:yes gene_type:complete